MIVKRDKMFGKIEKDLVAMSNVVFEQVEIIRKRLDAQIITDVESKLDQNELILDSFEVKLRRNVINTIMLHNPRATDMRKIISCYDIAINLERIGDLLLNIQHHLDKINFKGAIYKDLKPMLSKIYSTTELMVKNAFNSYLNQDVSLTLPTIQLDDTVDSLYHEIRNRIVVISKGKSHAESDLYEIMAVSDLSYNIERIADYATNIIEASVYLIEGKNIQHTKIV